MENWDHENDSRVKRAREDTQLLNRKKKHHFFAAAAAAAPALAVQGLTAGRIPGLSAKPDAQGRFEYR